MLRTYGCEYKIVEVLDELQKDLVGKRVKLDNRNTHQPVSYVWVPGRGYFISELRVMQGANEAVLKNVKVKLFLWGQVCTCKAYRFPHRWGSGKCLCPGPTLSVRFEADHE